MRETYLPALAALHACADGDEEAEALLADLEAGKLVDRDYRDAVEQLLEAVCPIHGQPDGDELQFNRAHRGWLISAIEFACPEPA